MTRAGVALASLGILLGAAGVARADPSLTDQQLAQSLFDKARALMAAGQYEQACGQFAESQRLDPGGGTLLNLAVCHEKQGRTGSSWIEFSLALSQAIKEGRHDREQLAKEHLAALEPRLSRLTVTVALGANEAGLVVALDGEELRPTAWGVATVVDPGTHRLEARAPGRPAWTSIVPIGEAEQRRVEVPASDSPPAPPPPPAIRIDEAPRESPPLRAQPRSTYAHYSAWRDVEGFLTLAAFGTSAIAGIVAAIQHASFTSNCNMARDFCSSDALSSASSAHTWAWVSTISLGAGVVGSVVYLVWPKQQASPSATVGVAFLPGGAALSFAGRFE